MTSDTLHRKIAQLREDELRRAVSVPKDPPRPPGRLASELAPVVTLVAGFATLVAIAAPSL